MSHYVSRSGDYTMKSQTCSDQAETWPSGCYATVLSATLLPVVIRRCCQSAEVMRKCCFRAFPCSASSITSCLAPSLLHCSLSLCLLLTLAVHSASMLHKAATSFSPFKLQHLHAHVRSALNLNIGSNINNANNVNVNWQSAQSSVNANAASSSGGAASSSSLGSSASSAGGSSAGAGAGSAKWHAGRSSYGSYVSLSFILDLLAGNLVIGAEL